MFIIDSGVRPVVAGIYRITNRRTGVVYIGSASNIELRWSQHRTQLNRGRHSNRQLQRDWKYYGETAFEFGILEEIRDEGQLHIAEQKWLTSRINHNGLNSVYNLQLNIPVRPTKSASHRRFVRNPSPSAWEHFNGCVTAFAYIIGISILIAIPLLVFLSPIILLRTLFEVIGVPTDVATALGVLGGTVPGALLLYGCYRFWHFLNQVTKPDSKRS